MPYITKSDRPRYDGEINEIVEKLVNKLPGDNGKHYNEGELNYIISSIVWKLFNKRRSYSNGNTLVGVLECVKQEFIRRKLNPYEDEKIQENGDI
jgi:hypothetical protein